MSTRLVFLGTGSGKPTPSRNVSSVGLFREGELFLFDCGEGTQTQMAKSSLRPGGLKAIFISHFHGDHVNGLPGLIGSLVLGNREEALTIVGPVGLKLWFTTLRKLHILWPSFHLNIIEIEESGVVYETEEYRVSTEHLNHRIKCWGYRFEEFDRPGRFDLEKAKALGIPAGPDFGRLQKGESITLANGNEVRPDDVLGLPRPGLSVAYCCDTIPCDGAANLARGVDLLIHESTYPGGEEKLAKKRGHSTSADAARCAKEAGAKKLVLTHLSQKHPNKSIFIQTSKSIFPNVIAAHDLMEIELERREEK